MAMVTRFEIALKPEFADPRGASVRERAADYLGLRLEDVRTRDVYKVRAALSDDEAERILHELIDPVSQVGARGRIPERPEAFDAVVHVGYKPGVTDPVGKSARVAVQDTLGRALGDDDAVFTSRLYLLKGTGVEEADRLAHALLANPLIETIKVRDAAAWLASPVDASVPAVDLDARPDVRRIELEVSDDALASISRDGLLALSLVEMRTIREHFRSVGNAPARRAVGLDARPTDAELECL
ncbi:MAG: phosphoribosylformylglycinamidine synthase subunit PurS, partial [Planctomycetota bacterium]|nr:phosphoribosylformylglycinamidine synthase subunit PurS [Planctomycetota bacterium]